MITHQLKIWLYYYVHRACYSNLNVKTLAIIPNSLYFLDWGAAVLPVWVVLVLPADLQPNFQQLKPAAAAAVWDLLGQPQPGRRHELRTQRRLRGRKLASYSGPWARDCVTLIGNVWIGNGGQIRRIGSIWTIRPITKIAICMLYTSLDLRFRQIVQQL